MNTFKKIIIHLSVATMLLVLFAPIVHGLASGDTVGSGGSDCSNSLICNPLKNADDLPSLIKAVLNNIIVPIGSVACVVWIIWAGYKFVAAQGNSTEITKAKDSLLWALIGTGVLLGAAAISTVVENTIKGVVDVH